MKNKFSIAMSLAVILAILLTSVGLADQLVADADVLLANNQASKDLGHVAPGAHLTAPVSFTLVCNGAQHVDDNQTVVLSFSLADSTIPGGSLSATGASIGALSGSDLGIPSAWPDDGTNCAQNAPSLGDNGDSTVTIDAPTTAGSYTYVVAYARNISAPDISGGLTLATFTLTVDAPADTTAPVISYVLNPASPDGANGWYKSNVSLVWTVTDPESSVTKTGCVDQNITSDQTATTYTCSATSAGGTAATVSVTIKRDATKPGITFVSPSTLVWYNADVTANWSCSDATSGPVNTSVSGSASGEGNAVAALGTCVDNAGNTASDTQYFQIDKTAPSITGSASPAANGYGWNKTDVTVSFTCGDSLSGIASCGPDQTLSSEGAGQSVTGNAADYAGNTNSATVGGINIDKTAPTASASASPAANANGWNNTDVTVTFSGNDGLSGIASCDPAVLLNTEGASQPASGTCTDKAGNVSAAAIATVSIDKTAPSVSLVGGPANGGSYYFGFVPAAPACNASDGLSGLDGSCSTSGYSTALGSHTVTASATDKAGNSASASATYTVLAWTLKGFYQPVDMNGVFNTVKGGSTVPLKFEVFAANELTDTSVVKSFIVTQIACNDSAPIDDIELVTTGGTSLRYDATAGQFIQNWQTPKAAGMCYKVTMTTQDGSSLSAFFKTK